MKKEDINRFKLAINKTRVSLPGPQLNEKEKAWRTEVFWEELLPYGIEQVELAFERARRELKFFPSPVEIIEFITKRDPQLEHQKYLEKVSEEHLIPWMEPTEEGRQIAKKFMNELFDRWEKQDQEKKKNRNTVFEERRGELKKQAKMFK